MQTDVESMLLGKTIMDMIKSSFSVGHPTTEIDDVINICSVSQQQSRIYNLIVRKNV